METKPKRRKTDKRPDDCPYKDSSAFYCPYLSKHIESGIARHKERYNAELFRLNSENKTLTNDLNMFIKENELLNEAVIELKNRLSFYKEKLESICNDEDL